MLAAIDDIHHGHRQGAGKNAADMAIKRNVQIRRRRLGNRKRDRQHGIGAQPRLIGRAIQFDHRLVNLDLIEGIEAGNRVKDFAFHTGHRLQHALAAIAGLVAIAEFHRLMRAGGSAGWHNGMAAGAGIQHHFGLHGWVAAGIEHFAGDDIGNGGHGRLSSCRGFGRLATPACPGRQDPVP